MVDSYYFEHAIDGTHDFQRPVAANQLAFFKNAYAAGILDKDLTEPPPSPSNGDAYIVASIASGEWEGHENQIAIYKSGRWGFVVPIEGMLVFVQDESLHYIFDGSLWQIWSGGGPPATPLFYPFFVAIAISNIPPNNPQEGDVYIIGPSPVGAWSGHPHEITVFYQGSWVFTVPEEGYTAYVQSEDQIYCYYSSEHWVSRIQARIFRASEEVETYQTETSSVVANYDYSQDLLLSARDIIASLGVGSFYPYHDLDSSLGKDTNRWAKAFVSSLIDLNSLKTLTGTEYLRIVNPSMSSSEIKTIIEGAQNKVVWFQPGVYILAYNLQSGPAWSLPSNCTIIALGAEIQFRYTNTAGSYGEIFVSAYQKQNINIIGGIWWIDRNNSAQGATYPQKYLFFFNGTRKVLFLNILADNGTGGFPAIYFLENSFENLVVNCTFRPMQNSWTTEGAIYSKNGSIEIVGCLFEGFYPGTTSMKMRLGVPCEVRASGLVIKDCTFRHLGCGISLGFPSTGSDRHFVHISDCDFIEMALDTWYSVVSFSTYGGASAGYRLFDVVIEDCMFQGGGSDKGQIGPVGTATYCNTGIKNLILRNLVFNPISPYSTAKYAINFPWHQYGTNPNTLNTITELSAIFRSGFSTAPFNIHSDIPIGKFDVRVLDY